MNTSNTPRISTQTATRSAALGLSALCTLAVLASINLLATPAASNTVMATFDTPAAQVIVIEGKRLRS